MPILTTDDAEAIRKKLQRAKDTFRVETQEEGGTSLSRFSTADER